MASAAGIIRVTMFKIPSPENQKRLLDLYKTLSGTALKDGKPYILSLQAGLAYDDPRSQGYTVIAKTEFESKETMDYYDHECDAHKTLKMGVKSLAAEGTMTVYYPPSVSAAI